MAKTFAAKTRAKIETATECVDAGSSEEMTTGNARISPSELRMHKVSVCMKSETYDGIKAIAHSCGVSVSTLLNQMVTQYVENNAERVRKQLETQQENREQLNIDAGSEE